MSNIQQCRANLFLKFFNFFICKIQHFWRKSKTAFSTNFSVKMKLKPYFLHSPFLRPCSGQKLDYFLAVPTGHLHSDKSRQTERVHRLQKYAQLANILGSLLDNKIVPLFLAKLQVPQLERTFTVATIIKAFGIIGL